MNYCLMYRPSIYDSFIEDQRELNMLLKKKERVGLLYWTLNNIMSINGQVLVPLDDDEVALIKMKFDNWRDILFRNNFKNNNDERTITPDMFTDEGLVLGGGLYRV